MKTFLHQRERTMLQIALLLAATFVISGCSTLSLIYEFGDDYTAWRADDYLDLTGQQEDFVDSRMETLLEWHRINELPTYAAFLEEVQQRGRDGLTMAELEEGQARMETAWQRLGNRAIPDIARLLTTVTPEQIVHLEQEIQEENEEYKEELDRSSEEHQRKRQERLVDTLENWLGSLSKSQKLRLSELQTQWAAASLDSTTERLQRRRRSQPRFLALLRSKPTEPEIAAWLTEWVETWGRSSNTPEERAQRQARELRNRQRILAVDQLLTPEQRQHAVAELQGYIDQMHELAAEPPSVSVAGEASTSDSAL